MTGLRSFSEFSCDAFPVNARDVALIADVAGCDSLSTVIERCPLLATRQKLARAVDIARRFGWKFRVQPCDTEEGRRTLKLLYREVFAPFLKSRSIKRAPFNDERQLMELACSDQSYWIISASLERERVAGGLVRIWDKHSYATHAALENFALTGDVLVDVHLMCAKPGAKLNATKLTYAELFAWAGVLGVTHISLGVDEWSNFWGRYLGVLESKLELGCRVFPTTTQRCVSLAPETCLRHDLMLFACDEHELQVRLYVAGHKPHEIAQRLLRGPLAAVNSAVFMKQPLHSNSAGSS